MVKPIDLDGAAKLVSLALESRRAERGHEPAPAAARPAEATLVGQSAAIQEVYKRIGRVADSASSVLILGQTGTGKELVARAIHQLSRGRAGPFVAVNCAALPEHLVESELFGHVRGAFTGAVADRPGRFEAADGGTLFFDEIGELPPPAQVKLLRFLDTQTIERLGAADPVRVDVRILAATNRDLAAEMAAGRFRRDLYYRLAVIQMELPPLAARPEDILPLARHFLALRSPPGCPVPVLSREAAAVLQSCAWPGNVRELRNAIEHAVVASGGGPILPAHLPEAVRRGAGPPEEDRPRDVAAAVAHLIDALGGRPAYRTVMAQLEKELIRRALEETGGNQSVAAERLGLHRNTLRHKLRELGLDA
jgi:DNA-binding NtrC family response regulator